MLDKLPYDAILGYDLLKANSPMQCDWQAKILQFQHMGTSITIQGLTNTPDQVTPISATQLYKSSQGNDIWAYVIVDPMTPNTQKHPPNQTQSEDLRNLLVTYADVFQDTKHLPPPRSYDHSIPLQPGTVLVNS